MGGGGAENDKEEDDKEEDDKEEQQHQQQQQQQQQQAPAAAVCTLYSLMQSGEARLGGGEGMQGIYGSITQASMSRVLDALAAETALGPDSIMLDVGAGLGRPLMHALVSHDIKRAVGIELDDVKVAKARALVRYIDRKNRIDGRQLAPCIDYVCSDIADAKAVHTDDVTHCYSFWEGLRPDAKEAFGRLVQKSDAVQGVAVVQRAVRGRVPGAVSRTGRRNLTPAAGWPSRGPALRAARL